MFRNLKLCTKFWGLTGLLLTALLLVAVISVGSINVILSGNRTYAGIADHDIFMLEKQVDSLKWISNVKDVFIEKLDLRDVQLDHTQCSLGKFLHGAEAEALAESDPVLAGLLEAVKQPHIRLHESARQIDETIKEKGHWQAYLIFKEATLPALEETQSKITALTDRLRTMKKTSEDEMISMGSTSRWITILATVIAAIFGSLVSFAFIRSLIRPIQRIISGLDEGAYQVASASSQVTSGSHSLAAGSSEQAASLEETSSSLEEMSSMTKQNANHAGQADNLMKESMQIIEKANTAMTDLTTSMQEISNASEETQKIVKAIDEIAFQTNLLALNAAVEAARAGEAGSGFAVVADEVRSLAMRAAEAAKNTAQLIEGTVHRIDEGSEIVTRTNDAFTEVTRSSTKVEELVSEIAAASNEQALGIEQINTAISEIDKVTQQNAASAEESASAAQQMSAQACEMKAMMNELVRLVNGVDKKNEKLSSQPTQQGLTLSRPQVAVERTKGMVSRHATAEEIIPFETGDDLKNF